MLADLEPGPQAHAKCFRREQYREVEIVEIQLRLNHRMLHETIEAPTDQGTERVAERIHLQIGCEPGRDLPRIREDEDLPPAPRGPAKIGRASCRERGSTYV